MARMNNNRRGTVAITIIVILAVAIATIFIFRAIYSNNQPDTSNQPTDSQNSTAESQPDNSSDTPSTEPDDAAPDDDTPVQYEGADPNSSATVEAVLTYYGVQNGEYIVNVNIPQYLSGTCQITLGNYTGSVAIDQSAASSACSFHIPISQLQSGLQTLRVDIQSSAATGTLEEKIDVSL